MVSLEVSSIRSGHTSVRLSFRMITCLDLSVSSSSWGLGRAAVCDCGTTWTFLLPFFEETSIDFH